MKVCTYNLLVCFKVSKELWDVLDDYRRKTGKTRSEIIREALKDYLELRGYRVSKLVGGPTSHRHVYLSDRDVILV
jgi:predicted transcriptional regulator